MRMSYLLRGARPPTVLRATGGILVEARAVLRHLNDSVRYFWSLESKLDAITAETGGSER